MNLRNIALLAVAASGLFAFVPGQAEAKPFFLFRPFLPGYNDGYPPPDNVYYMDEEEYYQYLKRQRRRQRILEDYYSSRDSGYDDPDYYDREPVPYEGQRRVKKKTAKAPAVAKKPAKKVATKKPAAKPASKAVASTKTSLPANGSASGKEVVTASTAAATSSGSLSCNKAADIVSGYGFESVKAGTCSGSTYSFNASRSGKPYLVKVNASSGELTEVKKL